MELTEVEIADRVGRRETETDAELGSRTATTTTEGASDSDGDTSPSLWIRIVPLMLSWR